jgi:phage tail protein X
MFWINMVRRPVLKAVYVSAPGLADIDSPILRENFIFSIILPDIK